MCGTPTLTHAGGFARLGLARYFIRAFFFECSLVLLACALCLIRLSLSPAETHLATKAHTHTKTKAARLGPSLYKGQQSQCSLCFGRSFSTDARHLAARVLATCNESLACQQARSQSSVWEAMRSKGLRCSWSGGELIGVPSLVPIEQLN